MTDLMSSFNGGHSRQNKMRFVRSIRNHVYLQTLITTHIRTVVLQSQPIPSSERLTHNFAAFSGIYMTNDRFHWE